MGFSANAHLFWGYDLGAMDSGSPDWEDLRPAWLRPEDEDDEYGDAPDIGDWPVQLAKVAGLTVPVWPSAVFEGISRGTPGAWEAARQTPEYRAYEAAQDAVNALAKETGCSIGWHGSQEGETYPYVYVVDSLQESTGWEPITLDEERVFLVTTHHEWWQRLASFCSLLELPIVGGPGWILCASYG